MKAQSIGKYNSGGSTLEILIAFAVLILILTAVIMIGFGNQSVSVDAETNNEALYRAQKILEDARATSRENFFGVNSTSTTETTPEGLMYSKLLNILDITPCKKQATSTITWSLSPLRTQTIELSTFFTDIKGALALGGDCATNLPIGGWNPPEPFASYKFNPGNPVALDVLNAIAYVVDDKEKLNIVDTSSAFLNFHGDFLTPAFDAGINLNDIDVAKWIDPSSGAIKYYAYVVRHENPNQFQIVDVTNINTPSSTPTMIKTLGGSVPPSGANSEGWRVFYYDNYAYVITRETGGYEFHIFNVTTPTNPAEEGPGYQINGTTNDFAVIGVTVNGIARRIAYLVTDRSTMEIMILDVTNPNNPQLLTSINLPDQGSSFPDALSIYTIGNRIYVGRQKTSFGPEFYVFTISYGVNGLDNLTANFSQIGSQEMDGDVKYIIVSGKFAFVAVDTPQNEFQVWDISKPTVGINRIDLDEYNLPNKIDGGMDYEDPYIYIGSLAGDALQILYSQ